MNTDLWFKWGWYFTLTVESGVQYPSTQLKWNTVESDFLLPNDRLYGGGIGIIQFTSENYELLLRTVRNGYDITDFPEGRIKDDLTSGVKTLDWFKSSRSPEGGLFNVAETMFINDMLESEEGIEAQTFFNEKYFFQNNKTVVNGIKNSNLDNECKAFLVNVIVLRPASVVTLINTNPSNIDELVANTLAIPQLSGYVTRMNNVTNGIKSVNLSDKPPVDFDDILTGGGVKPEPTPEPQPNPPDNEVPNDFFKDYNELLLKKVDEQLTKDIYYFGNDKTIGNANIKITKLMDNMYQVKLTDVIKDVFKNIVEKGIGDLDDIINNPTPAPPVIPIEPHEEPLPDEKYFPVDYTRQGVNFWNPPYNDTLKKNMDYGQRTSGIFHNGYDIGGGGINHKIYAVRSGTVTMVGVVNGYGYSIQIKHSDDEYYSYYAHLVSNSATVSKGDEVMAGQHIATMGNTGGNFAIHLHIEIASTSKIPDRENSINPRIYLEVTDNNKTRLKRPPS